MARSSIWSDDHKPYGRPPPGVRGDPDAWARAFHERTQASGPGAVDAALGADSPWAVLGLEPGAGPDDVKRAYRKRAMQTHPDHGGRQEDFEKVQAAYERLGGK